MDLIQIHRTARMVIELLEAGALDIVITKDEKGSVMITSDTDILEEDDLEPFRPVNGDM